MGALLSQDQSPWYPPLRQGSGQAVGKLRQGWSTHCVGRGHEIKGWSTRLLRIALGHGDLKKLDQQFTDFLRLSWRVAQPLTSGG